MRTLREILLTAAAVVAIGAAAPAIAQNATVHGKVINPAGQPVTDGHGEVYERHFSAPEGTEVYNYRSDRRAGQLQGNGRHAW